MASAAPPAASESPHGQALAATPGRPPTAGGDPHAVSDLDDDADSGEEDDGMPADMASLVRDAVSTGSGSASATPTPGGASNTPKQRMQDLVSWLNEHFEAADDMSLPRNVFYELYEEHCKKRGSRAVNTASFGKIIRFAFPLLQTRRLGVRGQSRYHYHGIRVKATSPLAVLPLLQNSARTTDTYRSRTIGSHLNHDSSGGETRRTPSRTPSSAGRAIKRSESPTGGLRMPRLVDGGTPDGSESPGGMAALASVSEADRAALAAVLGGPTELPRFGEVDLSGLGVPDGGRFVAMYRAHCERIFRVARTVNIAEVHLMITNFWRTLPTAMLPLLDTDVILHHIRDCDIILFSSLLTMLVPEFMRTVRLGVTHAIRSFGRHVENATQQAMQDLAAPQPRLQAVKLEIVRAFSQALQRLTALSHLAQAARTVLKNSGQMQMLLADWDSIDLRTIHETVSRTCGCSAALMTELEGHAAQMLAKQTTLEDWTVFLGDIFAHCVVSQHVGNSQMLSELSHQFYLRWSFYCCMIVRDLTLRSANSFGSYHLLRLFFDDYMLYLADERVAQLRLVELRGVLNEAVLRTIHPLMLLALTGPRLVEPALRVHHPVATGSPSPTTDAAFDLAQLAYSSQSPAKFGRPGMPEAAPLPPMAAGMGDYGHHPHHHHAAMGMSAYAPGPGSMYMPYSPPRGIHPAPASYGPPMSGPPHIDPGRLPGMYGMAMPHVAHPPVPAGAASARPPARPTPVGPGARASPAGKSTPRGGRPASPSKRGGRK